MSGAGETGTPKTEPSKKVSNKPDSAEVVRIKGLSITDLAKECAALVEPVKKIDRKKLTEDGADKDPTNSKNAENVIKAEFLLVEARRKHFALHKELDKAPEDERNTDDYKKKDDEAKDLQKQIWELTNAINIGYQQSFKKERFKPYDTSTFDPDADEGVEFGIDQNDKQHYKALITMYAKDDDDMKSMLGQVFNNLFKAGFDLYGLGFFTPFIMLATAVVNTAIFAVAYPVGVVVAGATYAGYQFLGRNPIESKSVAFERGIALMEGSKSLVVADPNRPGSLSVWGTLFAQINPFGKGVSLDTAHASHLNVHSAISETIGLSKENDLTMYFWKLNSQPKGADNVLKPDATEKPAPAVLTPSTVVRPEPTVSVTTGPDSPAPASVSARTASTAPAAPATVSARTESTASAPGASGVIATVVSDQAIERLHRLSNSSAMSVKNEMKQRIEGTTSGELTGLMKATQSVAFAYNTVHLRELAAAGQSNQVNASTPAVLEVKPAQAI